MWNCKITQDGENCWSVWVVCGCCDKGWHWLMTSMGPNAKENANRWMSNMIKSMENEV